MLSALLAVLLAMWVVWAVLSGQSVPRGWASLACLVLLMSSVQLISLGIIGEYMSRVFLEVKGRPTYLIASVVERGGISSADARWQGRAHRGTPQSVGVIGSYTT